MPIKGVPKGVPIRRCKLVSALASVPVETRRRLTEVRDFMRQLAFQIPPVLDRERDLAQICGQSEVW